MMLIVHGSILVEPSDFFPTLSSKLLLELRTLKYQMNPHFFVQISDMDCSHGAIPKKNNAPSRTFEGSR